MRRYNHVAVMDALGQIWTYGGTDSSVVDTVHLFITQPTTTTTMTTTSEPVSSGPVAGAGNATGALLAVEDVQRLASSTLLAMQLGNVTDGSVLAETEDVALDARVVSKLVADSVAALTISFGDVAVELPTAFLQSFESEAGAVWAISAGLVTENSSAFHLFADDRLAEPLLSLQIYRRESFNASASEVSGLLPAPILLTFPYTPKPALRPSCVFWDEVLSDWSTEGVTLLGTAEGTVTCATEHLSLFAVMFLALVCSNAAAIFSAEGLRALSSSAWLSRLPAVCTFLTLLLGFCLLAVAAVLDRRHRQHRAQLLKSWESSQEVKHTKMTSGLEIPKEKMEPKPKTVQRFLLQHFHSKVLLSEVGVDLAFLKQLYLLGGYTALHQRAREVLERFHRESFTYQASVSFRAFCKWLDWTKPAMRSSSVERLAATLANFWSGLALVSVFYSTQALQANLPEECEIFEGLLESILRGFVSAWIGAVLGFLPLLAVLLLEHKLVAAQLGACARVLFWAFVACLWQQCPATLRSVLVICIFISSVSVADGEDFLISATTGVVRSLCLTPGLLVCLFLPLVACTDVDTSLPFAGSRAKTYALRLERIRIASKQSDISDVCLSCQVPGHLQASTRVAVNSEAQADAADGICLAGLAEYHLIVIGIYVRSKFRGSAALRLSDLLDAKDLSQELSFRQNGKALSDLSVLLTAAPPTQTDPDHVRFPMLQSSEEASNNIPMGSEPLEIAVESPRSQADPVILETF
ncbi:hypothetical protein AK812_SmicGene24869 [Symbiodinium microadriaticum]|uniref:GAIN-B domain-containing protein n=1 Tax=Symbiodinium microadriaticum TaxID=2951 RepID=A0A1Q9DDD7_SYMMI|nr:hypothetical protein AK812_SmicGene24869 [Symbiodinium microadriaticum]CAE7191251.1 unnamed protein product [Symbiodinium microadriaticum]CAE7502910.1 unnamed protein product [Symbiodinium sp. KB8]